MRALALYLRSRGVPAALVVILPGTLGITWAGTGHADPRRAVAAVVLAVGLGVAVLGHGLGGHDGALDRTAAIRWVPRRLGHVVAMVVAVSGLVSVLTTILFAVAGHDSAAAAGTAGHDAPVPIGVVWRDAAAFAGVAAVAAALFGRQFAWAAPLAVAAVSAVMPAMPEPVLIRVLTWAGQPDGSATAAAVAGVLAVVGLGTYVMLGARPAGRT
ncbi:hypothetical protein [Actinoplanes sp. NPDC049265]|uniref:hypothetical protein n=1 Tax=Actinoplanes sp. NPDC049265 TaxID=3363902 RepID=UPI003720FA7A